MIDEQLELRSAGPAEAAKWRAVPDKAATCFDRASVGAAGSESSAVQLVAHETLMRVLRTRWPVESSGECGKGRNGERSACRADHVYPQHALVRWWNNMSIHRTCNGERRKGGCATPTSPPPSHPRCAYDARSLPLERTSPRLSPSSELTLPDRRREEPTGPGDADLDTDRDLDLERTESTDPLRARFLGTGDCERRDLDLGEALREVLSRRRRVGGERERRGDAERGERERDRDRDRDRERERESLRLERESEE